MEMAAAVEVLGTYTAEQWGMVTSQQAHTLSVDHVTLYRLKEANLLETVRHGVYAMTSAAASDAREEQAAWLSLRPAAAAWERTQLDPDGGVISHRSAARLHGLGELVNDRVELTVPRRRTKRDPGIRLRQAKLEDHDVTVLDGLPATTPLRTICDLLEQHVDASHIATIIRKAVESGQVRLDELAERIGRYARRYGARLGDGTALLEGLLEQIGLSVAALATRPSPLTWGQPDNATWNEFKDEPVTWGQLASLFPEVAQRLGALTTTATSRSVA